MAEPKHAGHDETDHQRDDRLCVGTDKLHPGRRFFVNLLAFGRS